MEACPPKMARICRVQSHRSTRIRLRHEAARALRARLSRGRVYASERLNAVKGMAKSGAPSPTAILILPAPPK